MDELLERTLTFVKADPPRRSYFAAWDPELPGGLTGSSDTDIELVLRRSRGTKRTGVGVEQIPMAKALDLLAPLRKSDAASETAHAWAGVVRASLAMIAAAKVLPWISADGWDSWRLDPLDASDQALFAELAEALPAAAHATPAPGRGRISDPLFAARAVGDALADAFIRTPAAHRMGTLKLFADPAPTRAPQLRPWVQDLAAVHCSTARLVLRVKPPLEDKEDEEPGDWTLRFELQSRVDPSLIVDAESFWESPTEVLERYGAHAETVLLAGLRTLGQLVEPLGRILDELAPTSATLADDEIELLLDALEPLADAGIDVRWPAELVAPNIERRLVVSAAAPGSGIASLLQLDGLLDVDWEFLLDGVPLSADELRVLSNAKRSVVSLRGRWVRLDRATLGRLRQPAPELTPAAALAIALGAEFELPAGGPDTEVINVRVTGSFEELVSKVYALQGSREAYEPAGLQAELRGYQRRGLAWLLDLCALGFGGCLADDMGLGKTIQVLALHAARNEGMEPGPAQDPAGPMLVVCPTSVLNNWRREAERFLPSVPTRVFHGAGRTLDDLADNEIVITSYGVVRTDAATLDTVSWSIVAADEAQHAKNPRSRTARALREISSGVRLALTGTPVENKLSELWSILDWAVPGLLGPLQTFRRTTALPIERDGDRVATDRLQKLVQPFLLRRHKTDPDIAPELPPKIERDVIVPLSPEQITLYKAAVDTSLAEVAAADGIARRGLVLKLLTALKQITNHPAQFLGETSPMSGRSGKLEALQELLANAVLAGEHSLVFTQYVAMGNLLVAHLRGSGHRVEMLHGGLSVPARQRLVDGLQAGNLDTLILSLKAGGTGLNLTRATQVIHYDRWWNPAVEDQATDRAYRIGQDQTVTVHRLITQGTVEDRVAELLSAKRALAAAVTGAGESWIGELDDDQLADLVSLSIASPAAP